MSVPISYEGSQAPPVISKETVDHFPLLYRAVAQVMHEKGIIRIVGDTT